MLTFLSLFVPCFPPSCIASAPLVLHLVSSLPNLWPHGPRNYKQIGQQTGQAFSLFTYHFRWHPFSLKRRQSLMEPHRNHSASVHLAWAKIARLHIFSAETPLEPRGTTQEPQHFCANHFGSCNEYVQTSARRGNRMEPHRNHANCKEASGKIDVICVGARSEPHGTTQDPQRFRASCLGEVGIS